MKPLTKLALLLVLMSLSGCAFLNVFKSAPSNDEHLNYPSLQTFELEGTIIYYKDLSNPCDETTVAWNDLKERDRVQKVSLVVTPVNCDEVTKTSQSVAPTKLEVQHQISIAFESRQSEILDSRNAESFASVRDFVSQNTQFQIYGAAGTIGKRSEKLGLDRATYVRDRLIGMGVQQERISIMPYDPQIPGLQALVNVLRPVAL